MEALYRGIERGRRARAVAGRPYRRYAGSWLASARPASLAAIRDV